MITQGHYYYSRVLLKFSETAYLMKELYHVALMH